MQAACAMTSNQWTIPCPSPQTIPLLHNVNRNASVFLKTAGIRKDSEQHKQLMATIRVLHRRHLHPFKYLEEQPPNHIDRLVAQAQRSLPWLNKYEDAWPARIYLKRYVDMRRPHLMATRYSIQKQREKQKSQTSNQAPTTNPPDPDDIPVDHELTVKKFLGSLAPNLEHHYDAFAELGIKDQKTLVAFLSWPQAIQSEFLDQGHGILRLTSLEKRGLLVGCGQLLQKSFQESFASVAESGCFC